MTVTDDRPVVAVDAAVVRGLTVPLQSVDEFLALDPDDLYRLEMVDGLLIMSTSPNAPHALLCLRLGGQLDRQRPDDLIAILDVDVDLEYPAGTRLPAVRRPDVLVVTKAGFERVGRKRQILIASETVLAVEVVSASSERRDRWYKRGDYADAGIPNYWIVDLTSSPRLTVLSLGTNRLYDEVGQFTGEVALTEPFPVTIDLDALS